MLGRVGGWGRVQRTGLVVSWACVFMGGCHRRRCRLRRMRQYSKQRERLNTIPFTISAVMVGSAGSPPKPARVQVE